MSNYKFNSKKRKERDSSRQIKHIAVTIIIKCQINNPVRHTRLKYTTRPPAYSPSSPVAALPNYNLKYLWTFMTILLRYFYGRLSVHPLSSSFLLLNNHHKQKEN